MSNPPYDLSWLELAVFVNYLITGWAIALAIALSRPSRGSVLDAGVDADLPAGVVDDKDAGAVAG